MASLISTTKFQPFSFERYMQPVSIYAQQYENRYKELQDQALIAGLMGSMVDPELDPEVYANLQKYNENLNRLVDVMSTEGLPVNSRKDFLNLWHQYASDVAPIKNWIEMRNKDIEKQDAIYTQTNGNVVFTNNPRETSLSYYKKGKPLGLEYSNLNTALAESSKAFETWAKTYRDTEEGHAFNNDFITYKQITGIKDSDKVITDLLERNGDKYPELKKIMTALQDKYGVNNVNFNDLDRAKIQNTLTEGALLGMASAYDEKTTIQQDPRAKQQMEDESWYYRFSTQMREDPGKQKEALEVQTLLGQLDNPDNPYSSLDYFDAPINESFDSYVEVRNKLYRDDGQLKSEYAGNSKTKGFVNPMKVYEYAKSLYDKMPKQSADSFDQEEYEQLKQDLYPDISTVTKVSNKNWISAVGQAKQHFGVNSVISTQDYNKLKNLGFDNKSTFKDFQYQNDFDNRINRSVKRHSTTDFNMAKYDQAENKIYPRLANTNYSIWEYDENTGGFKPGSETRSKEVFKYNEANGQRVKNLNIEGIGYNTNHKGYVLIYTSNNKAYYIPISALGDKAKKIEKDAYDEFKPQTEEQFGEVQNLISLKLIEHLNNYDPIASTTDSKR